MSKGAVLGLLILAGIIGLALFAMLNVPRADSNRMSSAALESSVQPPMPAYSEQPDGRGGLNVQVMTTS